MVTRKKEKETVCQLQKYCSKCYVEKIGGTNWNPKAQREEKQIRAKTFPIASIKSLASILMPPPPPIWLCFCPHCCMPSSLGCHIPVPENPAWVWSTYTTGTSPLSLLLQMELCLIRGRTTQYEKLEAPSIYVSPVYSAPVWISLFPILWMLGYEKFHLNAQGRTITILLFHSQIQQKKNIYTCNISDRIALHSTTNT